MPGRKSNISTTSNNVDDSTLEPTSGKAAKERDGLNVDDLSLPRSMISRLAKGVLPANTQIQKDALLALHKSATVFVSYLASNSNDITQASGKKTISPQDVIAALKDAELDAFLPRLEAELRKYNDIQCNKRNSYRKKVKEGKAVADTKGEGAEGETQGEISLAETTNGQDTSRANGQNVERPLKKLKRENGQANQPGSDDEAEEEGEDDGDEIDDDRSEDEGAEEDEEGEEDDGDDDDDDDVMGDEDGEPDDGGDAEEDESEETEQRGLRDEALDDPDSD